MQNVGQFLMTRLKCRRIFELLDFVKVNHISTVKVSKFRHVFSGKLQLDIFSLKNNTIGSYSMPIFHPDMTGKLLTTS